MLTMLDEAEDSQAVIFWSTYRIKWPHQYNCSLYDDVVV